MLRYTLNIILLVLSNTILLVNDSNLSLLDDNNDNDLLTNYPLHSNTLDINPLITNYGDNLFDTDNYSRKYSELYNIPHSSFYKDTSYMYIRDIDRIFSESLRNARPVINDIISTRTDESKYYVNIYISNIKSKLRVIIRQMNSEIKNGLENIIGELPRDLEQYIKEITEKEIKFSTKIIRDGNNNLIQVVLKTQNDIKQDILKIINENNNKLKIEANNEIIKGNESLYDQLKESIPNMDPKKLDYLDPRLINNLIIQNGNINVDKINEKISDEFYTNIENNIHILENESLDLIEKTMNEGTDKILNFTENVNREFLEKAHSLIEEIKIKEFDLIKNYIDQQGNQLLNNLRDKNEENCNTFKKVIKTNNNIEITQIDMCVMERNLNIVDRFISNIF